MEHTTQPQASERELGVMIHHQTNLAGKHNTSQQDGDMREDLQHLLTIATTDEMIQTRSLILLFSP
jgi:hypothetical protein